MRRAAHFGYIALIWSALSAMALASVPPQRGGSCERPNLPQGSSASVRSVSHSTSFTFSDPHPYLTEFYGPRLTSTPVKRDEPSASHASRISQLLRRAQRILTFRL